jgi:hypothetical protein
MESSFYIYCTSADTADTHPENSFFDFKARLGRRLRLEGDWSCGLVEFKFAVTLPQLCYVCCNAVTESSVGEYYIPVLRQLYTQKEVFINIHYLPVKVKDFDTLHIFIRRARNEAYDGKQVKGKLSYCTLHFKRND